MVTMVDPSTSQAMTINAASSYWRKRLAIDIAGRVAHGNMSRNRNNNQQQAGHMSYPPWSRNRNNNQHRRTRSRKMLEDSGILSRNGSHRAALPLRGLSIWRSCRTDLHMDASAVGPWLRSNCFQSMHSCTIEHSVFGKNKQYLSFGC